MGKGNTLKGTVKTIVDKKGFGFIVADGTTEEYFFHLSACVGVRFEELQQGSRVEFIPGSNNKGPRAEEVRRL